MDEQRLDDQLEPIYNSPVPIRDVAWKTSQERWTIEKGGERVREIRASSATLLLLLLLLFYSWQLFDDLSRESEREQITRTFLSILTDLNNAIFWMLSARLISDSHISFIKPLGTIPCDLITISITVTFMFYILNFLVPSFCFLLLLLSCLPGQKSSLFGRFTFLSFFFLLAICRFGHLVEIRASHSAGRIGHVPLACMVKFKFVENSQWTIFNHPVI